MHLQDFLTQPSLTQHFISDLKEPPAEQKLFRL